EIKQRMDGGADQDQRRAGREPSPIEPCQPERPARTRRHRGAPKHRHVAAERQLDLNGLATSGAGVIAVDRAAQPPRLYPYDRIGLRTELLVTAERLDRDRAAP